jgi:hypothetical protein
MSRWSSVYVPEIETGRHVKNNVCTVEIKIKWMIRKHMTYENTYRDDMINNGVNIIMMLYFIIHLVLNKENFHNIILKEHYDCICPP